MIVGICLVRLVNMSILHPMKQRVIIIDLNKWTTPTDKAANTIGRKGNPVSVEYICKLIRQGKLESKRIEELNLTLVKR